MTVFVTIDVDITAEVSGEGSASQSLCRLPTLAIWHVPTLLAYPSGLLSQRKPAGISG